MGVLLPLRPVPIPYTFSRTRLLFIAHNTRRNEHPSSASPGPMGARLCKLSLRSELRPHGVLRSS
jgi:hypothetical protein